MIASVHARDAEGIILNVDGVAYATVVGLSIFDDITDAIRRSFLSYRTWNGGTRPVMKNNLKPSRKTERVNRVASRDLFGVALCRLYARGHTRISAQDLANELWPEARHHNANGQSFNLASGIAGRMLRKYRGCLEVENRVWEIIPEFLPNAEVTRGADGKGDIKQ